MKLFRNIYISLLVLVISIVVFGFSLYHYCFSAVSNEEILQTVVIEPGSIDSIATTLEEKGYIRNKLAFKAYIKITGKSNLKAGTYSLSKNMDLIELVDILLEGGTCTDLIKITFKEGLNLRQITKEIVANTNNTEDMVYDLLDNSEYLNELIDKYWFLSGDILNDDIYYSLEGYLFPSTYYFCTKDVTVEAIFEAMLNEMENQLNDYKDKINNTEQSFHELLTLASIVELEGATLEDRKGIAGVLYNRLNSNMSLGCDATTYYGLKVDLGDTHADNLDLNTCNNYNTRCATFKRLPISPICNPSIDSILAALEPTDSNNYYFVSDKNRKVYFTKNITEHNNMIAKLKREGLWY